MAPTPSIKVVKSTLWRGNQHTWTNRYHFNGGTPADGTHWTTFANNVRNAEKLIYGSGVGIEAIYGYAAGSEVPVFSQISETLGTASLTDNISCPLEDAGLIRWATTARTSKNHPIYLFSYIHWAQRSSASADTAVISPQWQTLLNTYAAAWQTGFSDGTNTYTRAGPNGASAVSHLVEGYLTHRDFRH